MGGSWGEGCFVRFHNPPAAYRNAKGAKLAAAAYVKEPECRRCCTHVTDSQSSATGYTVYNAGVKPIDDSANCDLRFTILSTGAKVANEDGTPLAYSASLPRRMKG